MNLNKCERCGCFFSAKNSVCPNCQAKDVNDINCLKKFLSEQEAHISVESLSYGAGVSVKNINRYLQDKKLCMLKIHNSKKHLIFIDNLKML